jgi:hypothetical protein
MSNSSSDSQKREFHCYTDGRKFYDVFTLWKLSENIAEIEIPIYSLYNELSEVEWSGCDGSYLPKDVLENPSLSERHHSKIDSSDLNYAILINNKGQIIDGVHRLCKCIKLGILTIKAKVISESMLQKSITNEPSLYIVPDSDISSEDQDA